jgi:hypothetical protein
MSLMPELDLTLAIPGWLPRWDVYCQNVPLLEHFFIYYVQENGKSEGSGDGLFVRNAGFSVED